MKEIDKLEKRIGDKAWREFKEELSRLLEPAKEFTMSYGLGSVDIYKSYNSLTGNIAVEDKVREVGIQKFLKEFEDLKMRVKELEAYSESSD